uniref:HDC12021 n=1 Tax=Drosophila melanogaster TaxID=7227 RepID=Q6IKN5_DROME|nr:TPA_inf: HDC12021 [Drosophila melanogaster]
MRSHRLWHGLLCVPCSLASVPFWPGALSFVLRPPAAGIVPLCRTPSGCLNVWLSGGVIVHADKQKCRQRAQGNLTATVNGLEHGWQLEIRWQLPCNHLAKVPRPHPLPGMWLKLSGTETDGM